MIFELRSEELSWTNGSVKLDMLLLDMDFFSRMLGEDSVSVAEQTNAVSTIKYKGIAGY